MGIFEDALTAFRSGQTGRAEELALEQLGQARDESDTRGQIDALCMLARVALRRGDLQHASELATEALALARRAGERRLERIPIHIQAAAVRMRGDFSEARVLYEESIVLNTQLGERRMVAIEHRNLAYVELHDGHADRARELFASAAELFRAGNYAGLEPYLLLDSAVLAFEDGDRDRAVRLADATQAALAAAGEILDPDDAAEEERLRSALFVMGG